MIFYEQYSNSYKTLDIKEFVIIDKTPTNHRHSGKKPKQYN